MRRAQASLRTCHPDRLASYAALLIAGLLTSVSIAHGAFVPASTDSSGYVSSGALWRRGELFRPQPLDFWASWPNAAASAVPVGHRAGPVPGTEVSGYPPGFPLMIAAAMWIAGPIGGYLVAPVMGGVLAWAAFALARRIAGNLAGLAAAALVATSPIVLLHTVHPMSDVPAAACWALAWLFALRATTSGSIVAGLATGLAILIRPNLAPLAGIVGLLVLLRANAPTRLGVRLWRGGTFAACVAIELAVLLWTQAVLYGGPFASAYGEWQGLFSAAYVGPNLLMYPRLLGQVHTLLPLLGLALVPLVLTGAREYLQPHSRPIVLSALALLLVNFGLYVAYMPFDHWPFLRFLLPGLTALFILFSGFLAYLTRLAWSRARWIAIPIPLVALIVMAQGRPFVDYALHDWRAQTRIGLMGHYLREALPPNAAILSFVHSGALAYYTGREIVRLDLIAPGTLDRVVDDLTAHGYRPVFVLDQLLEERPFKQRFPHSRFGHLDWAPRAVFTTVTSILYFDAADRDRQRQGLRWPIDTLR